jgi:hypothetical protein
MRPGAAWFVAACVSLTPLGCSERPLPHQAEAPPASDGGRDAAADVGNADIDAGDAGTDVGAVTDGGARPGVVDWGIPIGSQPSPAVGGATTVKAVIATDDGGAIVAGSFTGSVAFAADAVYDGTPGAGFVARYRGDERLVWVRVLRADALGSNDGHVVVADMASLGNGETVVAGWFDGRLAVEPAVPDDGTSAGGLDAFVVRLASDGSVRWAKRAGGRGDDIARGVAAGTDPSGATSIALAGAIADGAVFGRAEAAETRAAAGTGPIFAARLDGDGALVWARFAGGGVPGQAYGVAHDASGAVAITGYVNGEAAFGNDVSGAPVSIDPAVGRAFVARWDVAGGLLWALPIGGLAGEGDAIAVAASGAIVTSGLFQGQARFGADPAAPTLLADSSGSDGCYVAAFTPGGETMWARRFVGIGVHPWRLRAAPGGDLLLAGSFGGGVVLDPDGATPLTIFARGSTDALYARLAADGALRWATAGGGPGDEQGADVTATRDGTTWAVGTYYGPARFGAGAAFGDGAAVTLESGTTGGSFLLRVLEP